MQLIRLPFPIFLVFFGIAIRADDSSAQDQSSKAQRKTQLNILFIGNSYTSRHNLASVVKEMAESGDSDLSLNVSTVIYGGRTLADHWRLGTQNIVRRHSLTRSEAEATMASLEKLTQNPSERYAAAALKRHRVLLAELESPHAQWDVIVLQSYRDDLNGDQSPYMEYATKFAELAEGQEAKIVLYETTPTTQNAQPLTAVPDGAPIMRKAYSLAALADRIDANVAPMSLVGLRCQTERPDLTLRFVNDAHLNQTMAYLTACTIYAALFDRSPEGLSIDSITDIRFLDNHDKTRDRDGKSITRTFSDMDRNDLQRIAWKGYLEFQTLRSRN